MHTHEHDPAPRCGPSWRARPAGTAVVFLAAAALLISVPVGAAKRDRLELTEAVLELPGAPAAILPADVDGDGIGDLVVVVAYAEWDQIGVEETIEMDQVEGLVEMLTIVPVLFDRRELFVFPGLSAGGFSSQPARLALDLSVLTLEGGPPGAEVLVLTDEGLSVLAFEQSGKHEPGAGSRTWLVPLLRDRPILAGTGALLPSLGLAQDFDGDGVRDFLLPRDGGASIYGGVQLAELAKQALATGEAWQARRVRPRGQVRLPEVTSVALSREVPLPSAQDVDGDSRPDLVLRPDRSDWSHLRILRNEGEGRFGPPIAPLSRAQADPDPDSELDPAVIHFGDLDDDGVAEWVTEQNLADEDAGLFKSMRQAKKPPMTRNLHRAASDLTLTQPPYQSFQSIGYAVTEGPDEGEADFRIPGGFQDLDGDGRQDLVTITLEFSLFQAVRVLATRTISLGMNFHLYCQRGDGSFAEVSGLDLSGRFRLRLDDLRVGQLSQFAGDFDGDGRADFVQMGRGRQVTVHRGREGCRYPVEPDLMIRLRREPANLALVRVEDFDDDELADLLVIQPGETNDGAASSPVRLDIYLSRGAAP